MMEMMKFVGCKSHLFVAMVAQVLETRTIGIGWFCLTLSLILGSGRNINQI